MSLEIADYIQEQHVEEQPKNNEEPIKKEVTSKEEEVVQQQPEIDIKTKLKELTGLEIDDVSKIKQYYESYTKLSELEKQLEEIKKTKEEYDSIISNLKLDKIFANDAILTLNEIMKKYPNIPPHIASKIVSTDIDKIDKLQAIVLAERLENPELDIPDDAIIEVLFPDLPENPEEWSNADKYKINKLYKEALNKLKSIKQIEKPDIDIENILQKQNKEKEEYINKLKNVNSKVIKNVLDEFNKEGLKLKLKGINNEDVVYEFKFDSDDIKNYYEELLNDTIETNFLTEGEDAVSRLREVVEEDFKLRYFDKIVNDYAQKLLSDYKEKVMRELHNPGGTDVKTLDNSEGEDYSQEILNSMLGK